MSLTAFDDCTLAEIETVVKTCLDGKDMATGDPMMLAGGVMWVIARRENPEISWPEFKANTRMGAIKEFSIQMEADNLDPTNGQQRLT